MTGQAEGRATSWPAVIVLITVGVIAAAGLGKVSPLIDELRADLSVSLVTTGWLISLITLLSAVVGLSAGSLLGRRADLCATLAGAMLLGAVSSALGAAAPSGQVLLAVRVAEGLGYLVVTIACPVLIAENTADHDRPLALALWGCFVPLGLAIMYLSAPWVAALGSWRAVFALAAVASALAAVALRAVPVANPPAARGQLRDIVDEHIQAYRPGPPLAVAGVFLCFAFLHVGFLSFFATYLAGATGLSAAARGWIAALASVAYIPGAVAAGLLMRAGLSLFSLGVAGWAVVAGSAWFVYQSDVAAPWLALLGCALSAGAGVVGSICFAAAPACAPAPDRVRLVNGLFTQLGSAGVLAAPPLFARVAEAGSWATLRPLFAAGAVIGAALLWSIRGPLARAGRPRPPNARALKTSGTSSRAPS